jgi:hypothetical protein
MTSGANCLARVEANNRDFPPVVGYSAHLTTIIGGPPGMPQRAKPPFAKAPTVAAIAANPRLRQDASSYAPTTKTASGDIKE